MHSYNTYLICNCVRTRPSLKRNVITYACTPSLVPFVFHDGISLCVCRNECMCVLCVCVCGSVTRDRYRELSYSVYFPCILYLFLRLRVCVCICLCYLMSRHVCVCVCSVWLMRVPLYVCTGVCIIRTPDLYLRLHAHFPVRIDETKHNIINFL